MDAYEKLVPTPSAHTQPHWNWLKAHKFLLQNCADCDRIRHYPRQVCYACYSMKAAWAEASGRRVVHSWTITHHPFHSGWKGELPYTLVTADLDEGVRMNARLCGADAGLKIGAPVSRRSHAAPR